MGMVLTIALILTLTMTEFLITEINSHRILMPVQIVTVTAYLIVRIQIKIMTGSRMIRLSYPVPLLNQPGVEATWKVINVEDYPFTSVRVYAPGGSIVFQSDNYQNEWTGTNIRTGSCSTHWTLLLQNRTRWNI